VTQNKICLHLLRQPSFSRNLEPLLSKGGCNPANTAPGEVREVRTPQQRGRADGQAARAHSNAAAGPGRWPLPTSRPPDGCTTGTAATPTPGRRPCHTKTPVPNPQTPRRSSVRRAEAQRPSASEPPLFFRSHFPKATKRRREGACGEPGGEAQRREAGFGATRGRFRGSSGSRPTACAIGIAPPAQPPLPLPPTTAAAQMAAA